MSSLFLEIKNRQDRMTPGVKSEALSELKAAAADIGIKGPHLARVSTTRVNAFFTPADKRPDYPQQVERHSQCPAES